MTKGKLTLPKLEWCLSALALVFGGYFLAVLLRTGFISDDSYNSMVRGVVIQKGVPSIWSHNLDCFIGWLELGRFMPLSHYNIFYFYYLKSVLVHKLITVGVILADVYFFSRWLLGVTQVKGIETVVVFTLPIFFQMRAWHDPILGFAFLIPLVALFFILALIFWTKYLQFSKRRDLILSVTFHLASLLTYEIAYLFIFAFLWQAYTKTGKILSTVRNAREQLLVWGTVILISILVRTSLNPYLTTIKPYLGSNLNLDLSMGLQAFLIQFTAAFPLSYFFRAKTRFYEFLTPFDYGMIGAYFLALFFTFSRLSPLKRGVRSVLGIGLVLATAPALIIGISGHQVTMVQAGWGFGYIGVFLQYFGVFLIFLVSSMWVTAKLARPWMMHLWSILIASLLSGVAAITLGQNRAVALGTNAFYLYPRQVLQGSLQNGLFSNVPTGAKIFRNGRFPYDLDWFFIGEVGRIFSVSEIREGLLALAQDKGFQERGVKYVPTFAEPIYVLTYNFDRDQGKEGFVYLAKLNGYWVDFETKQVISLLSDSVKIYQHSTRALQIAKSDGVTLDFNLLVRRSEDKPTPIIDSQWKGFKHKDLQLSWVNGFYGLDGNSQDNVRWASERAELRILNLSGKPKSLKFSMVLQTGFPEFSRLEIQSSSYSKNLTLNSTPQNFRDSLLIPSQGLTLTFRSSAQRINNGDPRRIYFGVRNFTWEEGSIEP